MKTTLEIPDTVYRRLKASAASRGKTVKAFVNEALAEKLRTSRESSVPAWKLGFGRLRHLRRETRRIEKVIADEFSRISAEDWK